MEFCCQLLLLPRPAASRYAVLPSLLLLLPRWRQRWRQRHNLLPHCCGNPPPLCSSSSSTSSFPFFVACCSFRRPLLACLQSAMVGCCLLLSTALFVVACHPAIVDNCVAGRRPPAAGRRLISLLALRSRRGRSLCRHHGRRRGPVGGHKAMAEDQLVLQC